MSYSTLMNCGSLDRIPSSYFFTGRHNLLEDDPRMPHLSSFHPPGDDPCLADCLYFRTLPLDPDSSHQRHCNLLLTALARVALLHGPSIQRYCKAWPRECVIAGSHIELGSQLERPLYDFTELAVVTPQNAVAISAQWNGELL